MEAVPKLPLISFELKVSPENTHFGPKLKQYIAEAYREDPDSYGNEIHQLEGLRSAAVRPSLDSAGLNALVRYFCQLRAIQSRFPMSKGQPVACSFAWKDLHANSTTNIADIRFEMACILYNIGALLTQLAASEPRNNADSLKAACTKFQNAAWAFMHLREQYPQPPGIDVATDIVRFLQEICFAQAQECILDKSIQDTRKPSVIGAVATQVLFFYKNSLALLGPSAGTDNIHEVIGTKLYNYWHRYLSFKASYIGCIVCLYQGMHAEEQQKMGERVAYYQQAADKLAEARKLAKYIEPTQVTQEALTFTNDVVEGKKKAAKNENEFIYHEEVPEKDLLMDLKPVCLVKALPINLNDPEVSGPDIFSRLVPMGAHEASSMYSEEKAKLLRHIVSQVELKNTELTEFMSSLQLDQLDVLDSDQKIPQEIVDRCAAMNAKTEIIQTLVDSMNNLAEIISDVEHSLAEIKNLIQEETANEKEYQKVMGPRPPSIVATELSREWHKYGEAHARTGDSNHVLHKAMTLHIANLRLLAQPLDALRAKIPSIDNIEGLDRDTMNEMRRVVGKAREMQTQRDSLVQQLREAVTSDDITSKLLARSNEPTDEIFKQELEKHTPTVKIIEQNLAAQENIINKLTSLYASYGDSRRLLSDVLRKRESLINALITSYDTYEELLGKSQKGQEFYRKLSHNVNQLLARLRSTCQVQQEERAQHLAKLNDRATVPTTAAVSKVADAVPPPSTGGSRKLKDYLPYMKNRNAPRSVTPQAQVDPLPTDSYYPEGIYPTSVRPAPVGSEATDLSQMNIPDGVVPSMQNQYNRYAGPYASTENEPYAVPVNYNYAMAGKTGYEKPEETNYGYSTPYTPAQYSSQVADPQIYSNPYYSATHNNSTAVTDSQSNPYNSNVQANMTPNTSQYNPYTDQYAQSQQLPTVPEATPSNPTYNAPSQTDMNVNFAQMQISSSKPESSQPNAYGADYSKTYYSVQYPQAATPNMATYSHAAQNSNTNITPSQVPADYSTHNYTYTDAQYPQTSSVTQPINPASSTAYSSAEYSYATSAYANMSQGYPIYTNAESTVTATTSAANIPVVSQPYTYPAESVPNYTTPAALSQLDAYDKPIKSHVTGEALSANINFQPIYPTYDQTPVPNYSQADQTVPNYGKTDQNMPGYTNPMNQTSTPGYNPTTQNVVPNYVTPEQSTVPGYANPVDQNNVNNYTNPSNQGVMPSYTNPAEQSTVTNYPNQTDQTQPTSNTFSYPNNSTNVNYVQTYQNHPGYTFNPGTGNYDYNYGSQNSYVNYSGADQSNMSLQSEAKDPNLSAQGVYTNAGTCDTVQSPSENTQNMVPQNPEQPDQTYYNAPYGYQTLQPNEQQPTTQPDVTNYGAQVNQSTYMQSGQGHNTNVTFTKNQVSSPKEEIAEPSYDQTAKPESQPVSAPSDAPKEVEKPVPVKTEEVVEPSVFDLLSDIDFSVEQKPLMPEIKVPQISESAIKKPVPVPKPVTVKPVIKEEIIERPAKMDLFSDPMLLNHFTQEVKELRKLVDSFTDSSSSDNLDAKWKAYQAEQDTNNTYKSKSVAMQHGEGHHPTDIVPFDESRLTLKSDPDAYINASYYKQLASWCIPLVISNNPPEKSYGVFWKAVLENKVPCIVCLLSEIEMQGSSYWPTAIGQALELAGGVRVTLDDVKCTVHWTERRLTLACGNTTLAVAHYQINVYPAKIVCSPLVLLADKILQQTYESRLSNQLCGAWIQCGTGGGRCSVLALLVMVMCQVRAGQLDLCDMLDAACVNLLKHRTNVLEDKKYLVDAYKTAMFYVQGVFCSGTTLFNGETVSVPPMAASMPLVTPTPSATPSTTAPQKLTRSSKFSRESFEEMKQSPGLKSGDMKDPLNFLDPLWSLKKK